MKKNYLAYLQLTLGMFFAGSTVAVGKYIVDVPIFISQTISLVFAIGVLLPMAHLKEGNIKKFRPNKQDVLLMFFQAVTGLFLFRIFILLGLRYTSGIASGIMMSTTPVVLALFGCVFLKERFYKGTIMSIMMCMGGMILINTSKLTAASQAMMTSLIGNGLILLAVIGEVLFTIFRKKQSFNDKPITVSAFIMIVALLLFLPGAFYQLKEYDLSSIGIIKILAMIYYGVFGSAVAYICWFSGIAKVKVSIAAGFSGVMPVSSVLLSVVLLKEIIVWQHIVGMMMTITSIYMLVTIDSKRLA